MAIKYLSGKRATALKSDILSDSLGSSADGSNSGITLTPIKTNRTTNKIDFTALRDGANHALSYDLGATLSDTLWVCRFVINFSKLGSSGNGNYIYVGLSDKDSSTAQNGNQDFIGTQIQLDGTSNYWSNDSDGGAIPGTGSGDNSQSWTPAINTNYYVEMIRSADDTYSITVRTGSHSGTSLGTVAGTCATTTVGLRYFKVLNVINSSGGRDLEGTIDTITIDNGASTYSSADYTVNPNSTTGWTGQYKLGTGAYSFDGTDDFVNLGTDSAFNLLNGGTVVMWVNTDNITDKRFAGKGSNGAWELLSETTDNKVKFRVNDGSVKNVIGTTALSDGTWYHIAGVYDKSAGEIRLYVNGTLENTTTGIGQIATISTPAYLGRNEGGAYYDGKIDDVGIYSRVLTATEILDLVNLQPDSSTTTTPSSWFTSPNTDDATTAKQANNRVGNKIEAGNILVGKRLTEVSFNIYVQSSYSGSNTASFKLYNSSGTERHNFGTFNVSSLGTSAAKVTQNTSMGSGVTVAENDYIGIENNHTDQDIKVKQNYNSGGESTSIPNAKQSSWNGSSFASDVNADVHMEAKYYGTSPAGALVSSLSNKVGLKANYTMDATSLSDASPTETTMLSTGTGWTGDTSTWAYNSTVNGIGCDTSTVGEGVVKDLGTSLSNSGKWLLRFKITRNSGDAGDGVFFALGTKSTANLSPTTSLLTRLQADDYPYGLHFYMANNGYLIFAGHGTTQTSWDGSSSGYVDTSLSGTGTTGSRWVEIQHHSATSSTCKVYPSENWTGSPGTQTRTFSDQTQSYDEIGLGTKWTGNEKDIDFEDLEVYVGIDKLEGCKNDYSADSPITNLPAGSIMEATDNGKHYIWNATTSTWTEVA